jgi:hypothetical protein
MPDERDPLLKTFVDNDTRDTSGSAVTVRNASHHGSLQASGSTAFAFTGTPPTVPLACTSL